MRKARTWRNQSTRRGKIGFVFDQASRDSDGRLERDHDLLRRVSFQAVLADERFVLILEEQLPWPFSVVAVDGNPIGRRASVVII